MMKMLNIIIGLFFIFGAGACALIPEKGTKTSADSAATLPGQTAKNEQPLIISKNVAETSQKTVTKSDSTTDHSTTDNKGKTKQKKLTDTLDGKENPLTTKNQVFSSQETVTSKGNINYGQNLEEKAKIKVSKDIVIKIRKPSSINSNLLEQHKSHFKLSELERPTLKEEALSQSTKKNQKKSSVKPNKKKQKSKQSLSKSKGNPKKGKNKKPKRKFIPATVKKAKDGKLWQRIRKNLKLYSTEHPRIDEQLEKLKKKPKYIKYVTSKSSPYIYMITKAVEEKQLPMEIALLPIIESAFNPDATSSMKAAGLWQIMPKTGERFGLAMDDWYDGRRDIGKSTTAALKYLQYLHKYFKGDWLLALAAYNAGEGRIKRAQEANQKAGKETDFWSLELPTETMNYVPKLLAISRIVANPGAYEMKLTKVANSQYLYYIQLSKPLTFSEAMEMTNVSEDDIRRFNPGFIQNATHPEQPSSLFLPKQQAQAFIDKIDFASSDQLFRSPKVYTVKRGDTLSSIAKRHEINYKQLALWNNLNIKSIIHPGQKLKIAKQPKQEKKKSPRKA